MVLAAVTTGVWLLVGAACGAIAVGLAGDLQGHRLGRAVGLGVAGSVAGGIVGLLLVGEQGGMHPGAWLASIVGAGAVLAVESVVRTRRRT
jgi:uncharacterized membrane protein YeaQ/YmgE (transglycosylase-associated protein family)